GPFRGRCRPRCRATASTRRVYAYGTGMTGQNPFADDEEVEITADIDSATER
ncbi:hypothetical protein OBE_15935, partial [human gut metagenome]